MEPNKYITVKQELKGDIIYNNSEPEHIEIPLNLLQCLSSKDHSKLQSLCRICFNCIEEEDMNSLISTYDNVAFSEIIKLFTTIQITAEDGLPFNLCITCQSDAIHCYKFRIKCEKSDCILQSLIRDEFVLKEESNVSQSKEALPYLAEEIIAADLKDIKRIESNEVKEECYSELEELDDKFLSEDETLCIVQKSGDMEKKQLEITITDSKFSVDKEMSKAKCTEKQKSCTFCSKKFGKLKNLREHILQKHSLEEHSHPCGQCKEIFSSEHDLHVHSVVHKPGPMWSCNICQKEFKEKQKLRRHIQRHMRAKRFPCDACGKAFCEMTALRRHARVHTGQAIEKKFACQLCDKRYSESSALSHHMARHSGERAFVCAACGKAFATPRLLRSHRRVHEDAKPHACLYCDKRFRHASTLNTHHRTHTGEKPYVCAVCGKTFIQNSNLTLHMRTHTGERPYSCAKCPLKFSSRSTLKAHQRRHTGEKPYGCDVCGKRFARQDLSAHKRMHAGARPHACSACPKAFVNAARLRNHTRIHTGEKPFECATCGKTFSGKSNLVQHIKKHQTKNKHKENIVLVQHVTTPVFLGDIMTEDKEIKQITATTDTNDPEINFEDTKHNLTLELAEDVPLEVTGELVVQDCDVKEILVVDNSQTDTNHQSANVCVNTGSNYANDVNLVPVNEGNTVKLYQLDQSMVKNYKYIVLEDKSLSAK